MEVFVGIIIAALVIALIVISASMRSAVNNLYALEKHASARIERLERLQQSYSETRMRQLSRAPSDHVVLDRCNKTVNGLLEHFQLTTEVIPQSPERIEIRKVME